MKLPPDPHNVKLRAERAGMERGSEGWGRSCKVADYLRIRAALRNLSANGSTLFANGDSRSVMPVLNTMDRKWLDKMAL
jgi:hypothetical protein